MGLYEVCAVVTQPDRPVGRHQTLAPGPIKALALELGIPVLQPERLRALEPVEVLREFGADVFVVFAYGQILPLTVLASPRITCLNLHASLLPRHRGAAPIQAAILDGDEESGLTVMYMAEGLDTGDILLEKRLRLAPDETGGSLHDRLAELAPGALFEALEYLKLDTGPRQPQDDARATYAPKLDRASGRIDWTRDAAHLGRLVRAMNPWPGAFTTLPQPDGRPLTLKIHEAQVVPGDVEGEPGEVVRADEHGIRVAAAAGGGLVLREMQLEGRKRLSAAEFLRGNPLPSGTRLGG